MARRNRRRQPEGPFDAQIDDLAHDGRGVAHEDGKAIFIEDALPQEQVTYMRTGRRASHDEGRLQSVITPSPDRVEPECPHFGVCGGCRLQHFSADGQISFKQKQLLENLRRIGKVEPAEVLPALTGPAYGYRRRARLGAKHVPKKGGVLVGFRERSAPYIAQIESCAVLHPKVGEKITALADMIGGLSIHSQLPQIEVAVGDNATALVLRVLKEPTGADLQAIEAFGQAHDFYFYLQRGGPDTIMPLRPDTPELWYALEDHDVRLHFLPLDFVQINGDINKAMVSQALHLLDLQPEDQVLELFAGLGNFSLPLARQAKRVISIEGEATLIDRLKDNAHRNGIENIDAHVGDLFQDDAGEGGWIKASFNKLLIDPPRSGAKEILPRVAAKNPERIVYVSCHPGTLARDAGMLVHEQGYHLQSVGVMDMFPHTHHVESMAVFVK